MLTRVIKVEADVKHSLAKPKTVDEALAELESRVGKEGRRKFERFLREVAEDEDEDDVDAKAPRTMLSRNRASLIRRSAGSSLRLVAGRQIQPSDG